MGLKTSKSKIQTTDPYEVASTVFGLYRRRGGKEYLGTAVSQTEHAIQSALCAERDGEPEQVILAVFLHDFGLLFEHAGENYGRGKKKRGNMMIEYKGHDRVGERFLLEHGVPLELVEFSRGHVDAKRYLCTKSEEYLKGISEASSLALVDQGGLMTKKEILAFEKNIHFDMLVRCRRYDDEAVKPGLTLPDIAKYEEMFLNYLLNRNKSPTAGVESALNVTGALFGSTGSAIQL